MIIHGDGEIPFANIVRKYLECFDPIKTENQPADGCSSLVSGKLISGDPVKVLSNLDDIPSPYTMGLYDQLLEEFELMPQIETVRGCPYECTYCTIGGNINKLRKHSFERIKSEILYIKDHSASKVMRIADSNWGIFKSDIKLAEFLKNLNHEEGYPTSLRVYYAERGAYANICVMAKNLKKLLPLNVSLQTLTHDVLKEIKRKNMPFSKIREMITFAHENNIFVSTELIYGLPGETYDSFRKVFSDVVKLNFDSIYVGSLYLIKGSELYTKTSRAKYNFETMYALIGKDATFLDSRCIFEADEVVVASSSMSRDDFWKLEKFKLFTFLCYGAAFLKEIIMHCLNYSITVLDIYEELTGKIANYPYLNAVITDYVNIIRSKYFNTIEDLHEALIKWH